MALAFSLSLRADNFVIVNARVHTVSGKTLSPGHVVVMDDTINNVGGGQPVNLPEDIELIDARGMHLFPGLIAPNSPLGLMEIGAVRATRDTTEVGGYTPDVRSWLAVNPSSELIPVARANGITHFEPTPQGGVVAGQSGVMQTTGWTIEDMAVKTPAALHLFWPGMGIRANPGGGGKSPLEQAKQRDQKLRELDEFFEEARAYAKARHNGDHRPTPAWEAILPWVEGKRPLAIHAKSRVQIESAVKWSAKRGWKMILVGGRDAWQVADLLARHRTQVIYEHTFSQPARDFDPYEVHFKAAAVLHKAGVKVAFSMGLSRDGGAHLRNLPYAAAQSAAFGLPRTEALKGLTLHPAVMLGLGDRLGSIDPGKEATFFLADNHILDIRARVRHMWIAGNKIPLKSRHTRLYEKYKNRPKPVAQKNQGAWKVTPPGTELGLDPFYKKHVSIHGFPIISSEKTSDYSLNEAAYLIDKMIGHRPDILDNMIRRKVRLVVMAHNEFTTQVPEHSHLKPAKFWDKRARGLGSSRTDPVVSCGEENLLCMPGDPYNTENILIHEFAHAIHLNGLYDLDPTFDSRLRKTWEAATKKGLWKNKYAAKNPAEYWAEGVQSWFDTNRPPDHDHNHVDTREELREYDPNLAKLVEEVFGNTAWRYQHPAQRIERGHLKDYNSAQAPIFSWPAELEEWYRNYEREQARKAKGS